MFSRVRTFSGLKCLPFLFGVMSILGGCKEASESSEVASNWFHKENSASRLTIVRKSANLSVLESGEPHLFINVTLSEPTVFRVEDSSSTTGGRFERFCLVEYGDPEKDSDKAVFEDNRTYLCYHSLTELQTHHDYLKWTNGWGYPKNVPPPSRPYLELTHFILKFDCSGVERLYDQYTCEVVPHSPSNNRECYSGLGSKSYNWGDNIGKLVCVQGIWTYIDVEGHRPKQKWGSGG